MRQCSQCGKKSEGRYCPLCGHDIPAAVRQNTPRKHRSRLIALGAVLILILSGSAAWLAQSYGSAYGWHLDSQSTVGIGAKYAATFSSGHYTAGVDLPAGNYIITAVDGQGSIATTSSREWLSSAELQPYRQSIAGVHLAAGDTLTVSGLTVEVQTDHAQSNISPRKHTDTKPIVLSGMDNKNYSTGEDFPAGD